MKKLGLILITAGLLGGCSSPPQYAIAPQTENYESIATFNNKVDVLIMIDNSSSMEIYQDRLSAQIPGMISTLQSKGLDFQIAVVTSDMRSSGSGGVFIGSPKFLTSSSPNLAAQLQSRVRRGGAGSDLERGLESIKAVFTPEYLAGEGAGFLREGALLSVIALTSEDDYSVGTVDSYVDLFNDTKADFPEGGKSWMVNFIGVPSLASSCSSSATSGYREPGLRWIELAGASNGLVEAICESSLSVAVSNINKRILQVLTEFPLSRKPQLSTLRVFLNGVEVPQNSENGWEYIASSNKVRFHGSWLPSHTDSVTVDFTPESAL